MCFLLVYHQKWEAAAFKGYLESIFQNMSVTCISLLDWKIWNQNAANCRTEKWGKWPYPQLLGADLGFGSSIIISARQGWPSPEVMPLSKQVDGQRGLGFYCFFLYIQNLGTALMWGRLLPCLFRLKKIRKDEGMEEWEERRQGGRKSQKRGWKCVFKWNRNNVNRRKYKIFISMQRVSRKTRTYGICEVLFFVLALFVLLKHFTCWQLQIKFSKENCNRSRTSRELKPGPRGIEPPFHLSGNSKGEYTMLGEQWVVFCVCCDAQQLNEVVFFTDFWGKAMGL